MESRYSSEYRPMKEIAKELERLLTIQVTEADIHFLTLILKASKVQETDAVSYDSIFLGHLIKKVVKDVSINLNVDLTDDFSLFQGLLAHMGPSIFRLKQQMELFNPLTEEIKEKYPVLFLAVKNSLQTEFTDVDFPDAEVAYIVLHFGSALLMNEEKVRISAVVVCPTGIGASKMLASRIQKELKMIHSVHILSIADFRTANLSGYDIVISTVRLPFTEVDYLLVNPLLSDKDIGIIEDYVQKNIEKITRKKYMKPSPPEEEDARPAEIRGLLKEIKDVHYSIESILDHFKIYRMSSVSSHHDVLEQMTEKAEESGLLTDKAEVLSHLLERERKGGLGIPGTTMGLFHCRDENIKGLMFQAAHLDHPCVIKGMDGNDLEMKSLLLMIAPENLSKREQEILSLISTSLIEDHASMMIYSSGNESMIYKKLEHLFLDYLQNNLI